MKIERFEDIESWKAGRELTKAIYSLTNKQAFSKDFGLKDQIQRASVSITSNIAEGFDSKTNKAFINFLNYSFRSASEIQSLLYAAYDLQYINKDEFDLTYDQCIKVKKLIGGFIRYLDLSNKK
ncbi:MAG: four helix bundle protein [Ignavibacteriaceae bacterium]|jgi:four helix bundle protein|nr:four helix bundle protein [Ignavibacteriaceae bacterium]